MNTTKAYCVLRSTYALEIMKKLTEWGHAHKDKVPGLIGSQKTRLVNIPFESGREISYPWEVTITISYRQVMKEGKTAETS